MVEDKVYCDFFVNTARGLMVKHRKNHGLLYMLVIFGAEGPGLIWVFTNGKPVDVPLRKHGLNADGLQRWSTTASSFGQ